MTKKNICAIILAIICVLSSCSADENYTASIAARLIKEGSALEFYSVYSTDFRENDSRYLSDEMLCVMLGKGDSLPERELIFSATAILCPRLSISQIIIFSLFDKSQAPEIIKLCERRIQRLEKYAKNADESERALIADARTVTKGKYVILLITDANDRYQSQIFSLI